MAFFNAQGNINIDVSDAIKNTKSLGQIFNAEMNTMSKSAQAFHDKLAEATYGIKDTKRIVSGILISQAFYTISNAAIDASRAVLQFSKDMETSAISMEYFVKGTDKAAKSLAFLREVNTLAAKTPFSTQDILSMSKYMQAMGIAMEKTNSVLRVITDAAAATGATQQNMERIVFGLGQIQTKGRLANEEIRQLANANIPVYEILQEELKLTGAQIANIGTQWVDAEKATNAILNGLEKRYKGAADRISDTMTGMTDTIKDNLLIISQAVFDSSYKGAIEELRGLRNYLDELREVTTELGSAGTINKILIDIDPTGQIGTDILNMVGNLRELGFTISDLYQSARPTLGMLAQSFYTTGQVTIGSLRLIGNTVDILLETLNKLGMSSEEASRALSALFVSYKLTQAFGTLGQGVALAGHNIKVTALQVWNMIPALSRATTATKIFTTSLIGVAGALGYAYLMWQAFNTMLGGTGEALENSLPSNYQKAYEKYADDMKKYNELIAKYQDDYNKPFDDMADSGSEAFDRIEDKAKKTAKAVKDGFIASFDEVYQVNLRNDDALKEAFEPVDFGAGIPLPEFKFPTVDIKLPEAPQLNLDAVFGDPIETIVTNGNELAQFMLGALGMIGMGGMGWWKSRFDEPKGPKGSGGSTSSGSAGSGIKANDPYDKKLEAINKRLAELKAGEADIDKAMRELVRVQGDPKAYANQLAYIERLVEQNDHSLKVLNEIRDKTPQYVKTYTTPMLDAAKSLVNIEKGNVLAEQWMTNNTKLTTDLNFAVSESGAMLRADQAKIGKQLLDAWKTQKTLSDPTALDSIVPKQLLVAFQDLGDKADKVTKVYTTALNELRTGGRDSVKFMNTIADLNDEMTETIKLYKKANIQLPAILNSMTDDVERAVQYAKYSAEESDLITQLNNNRILYEGLNNKSINSVDAKDAVIIKDEMISIAERMTKVQNEIRRLRVQMQYPTQTDLDTLAAQKKQADLDLKFVNEFGAISKRINVLLKPLKVLNKVDKQLLDSYTEPYEIVKDALADIQASSDDFAGIYRDTYSEVIDLSRDAIKNTKDIKQITDDMYSGVVGNLVNNILSAGKTGGVSDATTQRIVEAVLTASRGEIGSAKLDTFYKDLVTVTGESVSVSKAVEKKVVDLTATTKKVIEQLTTLQDSLEDNTNALGEFKKVSTDIINEAKAGIKKSEWKQISSEILSTRKEIVSALNSQEKLMRVTGKTAKLNPSMNTAKIIETLEAQLYEISDKAEVLNSSKYFVDSAAKLINSAKSAYGINYKFIASELEAIVADITDDMVLKLTKEPVRQQAKAMPTTADLEVAKWNKYMQEMFSATRPAGLIEHNPSKLWSDAPWQLGIQNAFRNPYLSGTDAAGLSNKSQYEASQFIRAFISNLTKDQLRASGIKEQPMSIGLLDRMVRGRVFENLIASTMKEALDIRNEASEGNMLKVLRGGYFIDPSHTVQAQLDHLLAIVDNTGKIIDAVSMDEKVLNGRKSEAIIEKVARITDKDFARYKALRNIAPDIAEQFVVQAIATGKDSVALNLANADLIPDRPNYSDYGFYDMSYDKDRKAAEKRLELFYTKAAQENSYLSERGNRVWKAADLANTEPILIKIPKEDMDRVLRDGKRFLEMTAKLVGTAIDGSLKKYLVGYTQDGIPLDLYGTPRNMPQIGDVMAAFKKLPFDDADNTSGLNSALKDIFKELKNSNTAVRDNAMQQLTTVIEELSIRIEDSRGIDTPQSIKIGKADVNLTPSSMELLVDKLRDVQFQFAPDTQLATRMKTLNDMVNKINGQVGESLIGNRELHDLVYNAQRSADAIENMLGVFSKDVSTQLSQIITNQQVAQVKNSINFMDFNQWADHTMKLLAAEEQVRGISFDGITRNYQLGMIESQINGMSNVPDYSTIISSISKLTGDAANATRTLAEMAMVLKQTRDISGYEGLLPYVKNMDPDGLKKAVEGLANGTGKVTLGSGFGAYADMTGRVGKVVAEAIKSTLKLGSSTIGRASGWAGNLASNAVDSSTLKAYEIMTKALNAMNFEKYYNQGLFGMGIRNGHFVDETAGYFGPNPLGAQRYSAGIYAGRDDIGNNLFGWNLGKYGDFKAFKEPPQVTKAMQSLKNVDVPKLLNNLPMYMYMASIATDMLSSMSKAGDYANLRKGLQASGETTLDLEKLLKDALEIRGKTVTKDYTGFEYMTEEGIMKNLLTKGMWNPDAFDLLYSAAQKQFDSITMQERYMIELMRGGNAEQYKKAMLLGTSSEKETKAMLDAIKQLVETDSEMSNAIKQSLTEYGYSVDDFNNLSDEALAYLGNVVRDIQESYDKNAMLMMDAVANYDPVNDNPLVADITRLVQGLDVSDLGNKLRTDLADTLGMVFSQRDGDDAFTMRTAQMMDNIVGWTQKLPERLTVDNLSTQELEVLAKAGVQINSDGSGTFMLAQNENKTGTTRKLNLTEADMSEGYTNMLNKYGIGLEQVAAYTHNGKRFSGVEGDGRIVDTPAYTRLNLNLEALAKNMEGAMLKVPSFANGDSLQSSISPGEIKALEGIIKFYDSGFMEVVDKGVLSGTKSMKQAIDELIKSGKLMYGLDKDVYEALTDIDSTFSVQGKATAEKIAQLADGIRVELSEPIEWFSQEDLAALAEAGIYIQAEGEKVFATINRLSEDISNGITTLSLTEFNKLSDGTRQALRDLGVGISIEGEFVKMNMQAMLDTGIKDVIALYLDDQGLWDALPNKVKETMQQNGVYTSEGFLVVQAATSEGMAKLGDVYAQKWGNISKDTKTALDRLGLTFKNELLTMQVVAANTPVGEGEILAKFAELPPAIQNVLTGGDSSIAAQLMSDDTRIKLRDATSKGFSDVATAVSTAMGGAELEVENAVKNMTEAITQAMINLEKYRAAAAKVADDPKLKDGGFFGKDETRGKGSYAITGAMYTPILQGNKITGYYVKGTDGIEQRLNVLTFPDARRAAQALRIPGAMRGGLINEDGLFNAGEFGKNEAIIPLEQPSVLSKVGAALAKHLPTGTYNITMARSNLEVALLEDILDVLKQIEAKTFVGTGLDYMPSIPDYSYDTPDFDYDFDYKGYEKLSSNVNSINRVMNSYLATLFGVNNETYDYKKLLEAIADATDLSSDKFTQMNLSSDNYLLALADMAASTGMTIEQLLGLVDKSGNYKIVLEELSKSTGYSVEQLLKFAGSTLSTSDMIANLSTKTGVSAQTLQALINTTGSYDGMLQALSTITGISTAKLNEFAGATGGSTTLLGLLAGTTGSTTEKFLELINGAGISIATLDRLSAATGLSTAEITAMMTSASGSKNMLDLLAQATNMSTTDFYNHMLAMGISSDELSRLAANTGISAGYLWELSAQTGMTTSDIAAMAQSYITIMDQMSDATGGARTNILGMSDEHFKQYMYNKQMNEQIFALTGKWDQGLAAANDALRRQYNLETDNFTYMDLILANYEHIATKSTEMATMSDNQYKYLMDLIKNGTPGQAEWARDQINNPGSESYQTGGGGGNGGGNRGGNSGGYTSGAYAKIPGVTGNQPININTSGKVTTSGLPAGTVITTADGYKYEITGGTAGNYTSRTISSGGSSTRDRDSSSGSSSSATTKAKETVQKVVDTVKSVVGKFFGFASGGVNDFTGPAMLHGTPNSSETIFNATDSKKLYDLVHGTPDIADKIAKDISRQMLNRMPTAEQVRPLVQIYNVPNGGINTNIASRPTQQAQMPDPNAFTQGVLEAILPQVFSVMTGSAQQDKTPIYVGNLIADKQGLVELERKLYDIRQFESTRR